MEFPGFLVLFCNLALVAFSLFPLYGRLPISPTCDRHTRYYAFVMSTPVGEVWRTEILALSDAADKDAMQTNSLVT